MPEIGAQLRCRKRKLPTTDRFSDEFLNDPFSKRPVMDNFQEAAGRRLLRWSIAHRFGGRGLLFGCRA